MALIAGLLVAYFLGNPYSTAKYTQRLLPLCIIGLGAGMNLDVVIAAGLQGIGYTVISIFCVLALGWALQKIMKVEEDTGLLITFGTAICGGSAIAALTPVIKARPHAVSVALATVFALNGVALVFFPPFGHALEMSERAFGLWSALAIHDTSSVVGATVSYGPVAAEVGTTIKLARALWIVPLVFMIAWFRRDRDATSERKGKKPWFILGFLLMAAMVTWVPGAQPAGLVVSTFAKRALVLTIFLIGLGLSNVPLRDVGVKPFLLGIFLWVLVSLGSLGAITLGWIQ